MAKSFKFSGNAGDMLTLIAALNEFYLQTGTKAILRLWLNRPAHYYDNAKHPVVDGIGQQVMLNKRMFDAVRPLLLAQPCIEDVTVFAGEQVDYDFDELYQKEIGKPHGSINRWPFYIFPNAACDLSVPWMNVPDSVEDLAKGKIIVTRTERYTNPFIHYFFLRKYQDQLLFVGLEYEHELFCQQFNLDIAFLKTNTFLQLAQAIKQCRFFMSNQTAAFQIAEGIKKPRILEISRIYNNVVPVGENAFDFHSQIGLEHYFTSLIAKL